MAQTPKLQSLVFCPFELLSFDGSTIQLNTLTRTKLPKGNRLPKSQFSETVADPTISIGDVLNYFSTAPFENSLPWYLHPSSHALNESVLYWFEDGSRISIREILYHPWVSQIPRDLLPLHHKVEPQGEDPFYSFLGSRLPLWGNIRKAEQAISAILKAACSHPIDVWMAQSDWAIPLKKIEFLPRSQSHWKVGFPRVEQKNEDGLVELSFHYEPISKDGTVFQNFELSPSQKTLYFHTGFQNLQLVQHSVFPRIGSVHSILVEQHRLIHEVLNELDLKLKQDGFLPIQKAKPLIAGSAQIFPELWIQKEGGIQFCRRIQTGQESLEVWNLPSKIKPILKGFRSGLSATSSKGFFYLEKGRKGLKRDRDLKLLKHGGLFGLIFFGVVRFGIQKQNIDGKAITQNTEFFDNLFKKLGLALYQIERKAGFIDLEPAPSIERLCSASTLEFIKDFSIDLLQQMEDSSEYVFAPLGEVELRGGVRNLFEVLETLLTHIAGSSKGSCFLKSRWNLFEMVQDEPDASSIRDLWIRSKNFSSQSAESAQSYNPTNGWLNSADVLNVLLPLQEKGFSLFFNSLPLDKMDTEDFKPELNLVETEEEANTAIDWFELNPKFFFKGIEIQSDQLEKLSKDGVLEFQGKIYLIPKKGLPSIQRLENFWSKIQKESLGTLKKRKTGGYLKVPRSQVLEMLALRSTGIAVTGGERWKKICLFYDSLNHPRNFEKAPESFRAELKQYQETGVQWLADLYELGLGGILADDMGLGKTIQALAFLDLLRNKKQMGHVLILVPTSLTYNWSSEAQRFAPEVPTHIFQSKARDKALDFLNQEPQAVLISTYGLFTEHQAFFESQKWNILIFDEAQNLKNISAKRTTASRKVQAKFKLCLTGTPLENHMGEFYSLLDLVVSGSLGDLRAFREKFITPDLIQSEDLKFLKLRAKPLLLRRTKSEILSELPPKIESTIKLPFEAAQEKIYRDIALSWNEKVKDSILSQGESKSQILMLTALLRLRQACSDPSSIPNIKYHAEPPKITTLMEALEEITESGESALVFTQFLQTFGRIRKELELRKIPYFSLHGGTSRPEREKTLKQFQETKQGSVLLMTLKTGGVGLNLVKASYVFHLEPWWNPAVENQATDRAHRIGQAKAVQVYRYLMMESVEEKIEILKERKSAKFNSLFSSSEDGADLSGGTSQLSQADFEYLLNTR